MNSEHIREATILSFKPITKDGVTRYLTHFETPDTTFVGGYTVFTAWLTKEPYVNQIWRTFYYNYKYTPFEPMEA